MGDIVDVRSNQTETSLEYQIEWEEDGEIYTTWEDEADTTKNQRWKYWFATKEP